MSKPKRSPRPADSRDRLIASAIELFGRKGREGVSTREIAAAAKVNIAGIAYHFGGKDQLYEACARHIGETIAGNLKKRLAELAEAKIPPAQLMHHMLSALATFLLATPKLASFPRFVLREQMDPSPAFEILYGGVMEPLHKRFCAIWGEAIGADPESDKVKLQVFSLLGQIFFFRMAHAGAMRRMGWTKIGEKEVNAVVVNARRTVDALLALERVKEPQ
jgi:TetR/AcrR family transcriptional regulator, regulator of cefoperazone and chloramphenicol sensitivity